MISPSKASSLSKKYEVIKSLGKGGQGEVQLCKEKYTDNVFARKIILCDDVVSLNMNLQEVVNMLKAKHEHIVSTRLFYINEEAGGKYSIHIIYEYCNKATLRDLITRFRSKEEVIDIRQIFVWTEQITRAIEYMHKKNIIHRDLKPANVFLSTSEYLVKIGDFGFAKSLENSKQFAESVLGTQLFLAPEMRRQQKYGKKIDVWGITAILLDMLLPKTLDFSFEYIANKESILRDIAKRYSTDVRDFVESVVEIEQEKRVSSTELLKMIEIFKKKMGFGKRSGKDIKTRLEQTEQEIFLLKQDIQLLSQSFSKVKDESDDNLPTLSPNSTTGGLLSFFKTKKDPDLIPIKEIKIDVTKPIINGKFFQVSFGVWKRSKSEETLNVAIKKMVNISEKMRKDLTIEKFKEISLYDHIKSIFHDNIEKTYGITQIKKEYYLVCEDFSFGSLRSFVLNHNYDLSIQKKLHLTHEIMNGMYYLYKRKLVHSNLKSDLIFLTEDAKNAKLIGTQFINKIIEIEKRERGKDIIVNDTFRKFSVIMFEIFFRTKYDPSTGFELCNNYNPKNQHERDYIDILIYCQKENDSSKLQHVFYRLSKIIEEFSVE